MIRVIVADDHPVVRAGVIEVLSSEPDIQICGEAGTGTEAILLLKSTDCDVLILDVCMPGRGVIETIDRVKSVSPFTGILALSMHAAEQYALRLLKKGASSYLTKDTCPEMLAEAVREIASGRRYLTQEITDLMAQSLTTPEDTPVHQSLSDREFEIFCRLSRGKSVTEIGHEMNLSHKTISTYRRRIMVKMGMSRNAELTHYSFRNNLIE